MLSAPSGLPTRGSIDVYVQARADTGMGHLARVGALVAQLQSRGFACQVFADADEMGHRFARGHNLTVSDRVRRRADVVLIDALDVPASIASTLGTYPTRILTSPNFCQAELATHVLVRGLSDRLLQSLSPTAYLDVDLRFAFTTALGANSIANDFTALQLGVCLTAGAIDGAEPILECLLAEPKIAGITMIGDISLARFESYGPRLRHTRFTNDPWLFLEGINVFVGGDGLMVGEAVARAIPTFSLTTRTRLEKNAELIRVGVVEPVLSECLDCDEFRQRVTDPELIQRLFDACRSCYKTSDSHALARAIERIFDDRG